jgi:LysR family transcriptional regulator, regulator of abg operon
MVKSASSPTPIPALLRGLRLPQLQLVRMAGSGANFREMADALNVTQPAITKMARELERALGAPVFERSAAGVRLNRFGQAVLSQVQRSLAHLDQLAEDLPSHREGAGAAVRIGSPSFTAAALLARPVARWLASTPGGRAVMSDGVSTQLLAMLRVGELDAVIGSLDDGASDDELQQLHFEALYDDTITFVTSADTPGLEGPVDLAELCRLPWILPPRNSQVWMALRRELTLAGHALPHGVVEASSIPAIGAILGHAPGTVGAARADAGRYLARHHGLRLLQVVPNVPLPRVGILRLRSAAREASLEALLENVRAEVRQMFGPA